MGMFYLGSVFAVQHGVFQLISGDHVVDHSLLSAVVLGFSFVLDAYVLTKAVSDVRKEKPPGISMFQFLKTHNDPVIQKRVLVTKLIHFFFSPVFDDDYCGGHSSDNRSRDCSLRHCSLSFHRLKDFCLFFILLKFCFFFLLTLLFKNKEMEFTIRFRVSELDY